MDKEEIQALAALYALGALTQHEAGLLNRLIEDGDEEAAGELSSFESVAGLIGLGATESSPPPSLRRNLLERIAGERDPHFDTRRFEFFSLRAGEGDWVDVASGIAIKKLFVDESRGTITSLVKMAAGTSLPSHKHLGVEQIYILEGDCYVHETRLGPGDFHRASAGSVHERTYTVDGTTFLLIAPAEYRFY